MWEAPSPGIDRSELIEALDAQVRGLRSISLRLSAAASTLAMMERGIGWNGPAHQRYRVTLDRLRADVEVSITQVDLAAADSHRSLITLAHYVG